MRNLPRSLALVSLALMGCGRDPSTAPLVHDTNASMLADAAVFADVIALPNLLGGIARDRRHLPRRCAHRHR